MNTLKENEDRFIDQLEALFKSEMLKIIGEAKPDDIDRLGLSIETERKYALDQYEQALIERTKK